MRKRLKAFTLVEMLIVMGIIIILMAVGIASGRFAIRRANKIEHQNAAEQIYQALQSYYTDHREYPGKTTSSSPAGPLTVDALMADNILGPYIDDFDGGSEATYAYAVESSGQEVLVCVTYGGVGDENDIGIYCAGNGINSELLENAPTKKDIDYTNDDDIADYQIARENFSDETASDWQPASQSWTTASDVGSHEGA